MGTLKTYKKFSVSKEETFKNIITDFSLSEEYARNYMEKYWQDSATDEDRANRIDYWARLFTATTWEEIKMLAQNNDFIASASQSLYESNADEITREQCRARENYMCLERKLAEQEAALSEKDNTLAEKDNVIAERDNALAEKDKLIRQLQKQLAETRTTD